MMRLREAISFDRTHDTHARDIYQYKYRVVAAFELVEYLFLESLIKKAVVAVIAAAKAIGEESVFKHLRLIGAITCPDPDRHPDVIKLCLWPLLSGPFQDALQEPLEIQMRTWLRNAYVVRPGRQVPNCASGGLAAGSTPPGVDERLARRTLDDQFHCE